MSLPGIGNGIGLPTGSTNDGATSNDPQAATAWVDASGNITSGLSQASVSGIADWRTRTAARSSEFTKGPVIPAPLIAGSATAYSLGQQVRLSSGHSLMCGKAGTSSGTAPVMSSTVTDGRPISDGTVVWFHSGAIKTSSDDGAPTITSYASPAAAGLTLTRFATAMGATPSIIAGRGCKPVSMYYDANYNFVLPYSFAIGNTSYSANATGIANAAGLSGDAFHTQQYSYEIVINDHKFGLTFGDVATTCIVEIDGRIVDGGSTILTGTFTQTIVYDYSGVAKRRRVRITSTNGVTVKLVGVCLSSQGSIEAPPAANDRLLVFGDSIHSTVVGGSVGVNSPAFGHSGYWLERYLGVDELILMNVGGSGYTTSNTNTYKIGDLLARPNNQTLIASYAPTHVYINAAINDVTIAGSSVASVQAAALAVWSEIRRQCPLARITVGDGFTGSTGPSAAISAMAAGISAAFAQWGDANSRLITPVQSGRITGTSTAAQSMTSGNSCLWIGGDGADGTHPSIGGARYVGKYTADDIRQAWA